MAEMKPPGDAKKEYLNSAMNISSISQDVEQSCRSFVWSIKKYSELEENVFHEYFIDAVNWHLSLIKESECVKIIVTSDAMEDNVNCCVIYGNNNTSVDATKIAERKFEIVLPSGVFEDQKTESSEVHSLLFKFKYEKLEVKKVRACSTKRNLKSQMLKLAEDLQTASVKEKFTDFILKTNDRAIRVPKALLAARSEYFKESGDKDSITLNVNYETVYVAVQYLYSGILPPFKERTDILQLQEIAETLKIRSLQSKCVHLAQDFLTRSILHRYLVAKLEK